MGRACWGGSGRTEAGWIWSENTIKMSYSTSVVYKVLSTQETTTMPLFSNLTKIYGHHSQTFLLEGSWVWTILWFVLAFFHTVQFLLHEHQEALMSFFSPSLLKRPDSHGTNLGSQRQPVKAHKKFLKVCGGREYPMYLQTLKVMEETRWRGRFQKQQADNGIYNARDLIPHPRPNNRKGRKRKQMENATEGDTKWIEPFCQLTWPIAALSDFCFLQLLGFFLTEKKALRKSVAF